MKNERRKTAYIELLNGDKYCAEIVLKEIEKDRYCGSREIKACGYDVQIEEEWTRQDSIVQIRRTICGICKQKPKEQNQGIRVGMEIPVVMQNDGNIRIAVPSMVYTKKLKTDHSERRTFMEDRLTDPMILLYQEKDSSYIRLCLSNVAQAIDEMNRKKGESRYLHKTETVSLGYKVNKQDITFEISWPYEEGDKSAALDAKESPAIAFYPLDGENFKKEIIMTLESGKAQGFAQTIYHAFECDADSKNADVADLPFTLEESRQFRIDSLGKTYQEFSDDGAGFFFHFDPKYGYGSRPSGFSTCYDAIPHNSYIHILEYGFTGRQINAAYIMAAEKGKEWIKRGEKVIDFFIHHCVMDNGWVYSLFDLNTGKPFYSFGDPEAPKLHYISKTDKKGNYLRTMTEPMNDLLECYNWYRQHGNQHKEWKDSCLSYADFLKKVQNKDGSWYRAYCPDGTGTDSIDRSDVYGKEREKGQKAVTAIPLVFLCNLCRTLKEENQECADYLESAKKAGDYVYEQIVREEHYQGATLDNPNQVDKEAAQYVMAGMWHLYQLTGEKKYLDGAENAAYIFVTWNYIWNAPMQKGNILYEKGFKTKGMGAINSVWGGGVVDIYSLFHIRELYLIGCEKKHSLMCEMAEWIAAATAQILSSPEDNMGFTDIGMQPEGFGICPQGIDEGMIHKGDIWGTLGWIYSAGIYGLNNYLMQKEEK